MAWESGSARRGGDREGKASPRILVLVPHEPDDDPRIKWVAKLCAEIGRTDVLGTTWSTEKQAREYDGITYVERVNILENSSAFATVIGGVLGRLDHLGPTRRYLAREGRFPQTRGLRRALRAVDHQIGAAFRFISSWGYNSIFINALYRRARAISVVPRVIVCHDIYALIPAVMLKRIYGCPVIYDSHEFWPQAELLGQPWETRLLTRIERVAIRRADVVITVSPPLARHLESLYNLRHVLSVPNAEPFRNDVSPSCARQPVWPVRFLLQGRVAPGRGIDSLLHAWCRLEDERAVLCLRCLESPYFVQLRAQFSDAFARGRIVILPPVKEDDLVLAATSADVGIIPYVGPNLNHVYACPNKLSQYMHAGLAILSNKLDFISEVIDRYDCGLTYDADYPESFIQSVKLMVSNLERLHAMKTNAYHAARSEFNWEIQSRPYRAAIHDLYHRSGVA